MLLDTHAVLWALADNPRLGPAARARIVGARTRHVSAVTFVELTMKSMRGRLRLPSGFSDLVSAAGFDPLPLEQRHVAGLTSFETLVRHDPFDRMLLAQAFVEEIPLLTADGVLLALDLPWIIDATK